MPSDVAAAFRAMADRIEAAGAATFGGACLVIAPGEAGVVDSLMLSAAPNPAVFWSSIEGQVSLVIAEFKQSQQAPPGMGGRRGY